MQKKQYFILKKCEIRSSSMCHTSNVVISKNDVTIIFIFEAILSSFEIIALFSSLRKNKNKNQTVL